MTLLNVVHSFCLRLVWNVDGHDMLKPETKMFRFRHETERRHLQKEKKRKEEYLCSAILADTALTKRSDMDHTVKSIYVALF